MLTFQKLKRSCKYYNKGYCKFGDKCRYTHKLNKNITTLPLDIIKIIFDDIYLIDMLSVCKVFNKIIYEYYPLRLFIINSVMSDGIAFSIARNIKDAIFQICFRAATSTKTPSCYCRNWVPLNRIIYPSDIDERSKNDKEFNSFCEKLTKNMKIFDVVPKIKPRIIEHQLSDSEYRNLYARICNIYFHLIEKPMTIMPLNKSMGFYRGGV